MRWLLIGIGVIVGLAVLIYVVGMMLPVAHVATVEGVYREPPERVFAVLEDVESSVAWRTGLERVEVLSAPGEPLRWRETSSFGPVVLRREESSPPDRLIGRIDDTSEGFGGRWVYELTPREGGTALRITEEGEVYSPLFRFMSRFIFGHYGTLEQYVRDLGRHFGQEVQPVRVSD